MGAGAGSRVFLAEDAVSGRRLVLRRFTGEPPARVSALEQFVLLRQLARSGFVAPKDVLSATSDTFEYTSDYIESSTLDRLPPSTTDEAIGNVLHRIAVSLRWLHALGYLHCDLKPSNILCVPDGDLFAPRILDLDLAHRVGDRLVSKVVGTGGYIAPELIDGEEMTCAVDVFSFGIILRGLRSRFSNPELSEEIDRLSDRCTGPAIDTRLQTFEAVLAELSEIARRHSLPTHSDPVCEPPLRETGLEARVRSFERLLEKSDNPPLILVCGAPGLGKSLLLREWCLRLQLNGNSTLRFEDVENTAAFDASLERAVSILRQTTSPLTTSPLHVIVETSQGYNLSVEHMNRLSLTAQGLGLRVYVECRAPRSFPDAVPFPVLHARALSERECIRATGHLTREDGPAGMNGKCLHVLAGGVPALLRMAVKSRQRLAREMPADFDYLSDEIVQYWSSRFHELDSNCQWLLLRASVFHRRFSHSWLSIPGGGGTRAADVAAVCERAGWLVREGRLGADNACRFISRSARNAVRVLAGDSPLRGYAENILVNVEIATRISAQAPLEYLQLDRIAGRPRPSGDGIKDLWAFVESPEDEKLMLLTTLQDARVLKATGDRLAMSQYARCCEAFGRLGNFRGQKRWARRGLHRLPAHEGNPCPSAETVTQACRLWDQTGDHAAKKTWLTETIARVPDEEIATRGVLLSEQGSVQLMSGEPQTAHHTLHQAQACLARSAASDEIVARNMIRLGVAQGLLKKFSAAEQSLKRVQGFGRTALSADIRRRALANLGWNAQRSGRPTQAIRYLLEAMRLFDRDGMFPEHVAMLSNLVACFVDIGHGSRARRAAISATALAQSIRDTIQVAYAMNSLGWVLSMQGRVAEARETLCAARRAAQELGDPLLQFRVRLNLARLYATAQDVDRATATCDELHDSLGDQVGHEERWDRARVIAKIRIDSGHSDLAAESLDQIPADHPELTMRDRANASLLRASLHLWTGDTESAQNIVRQLRREPMIPNIHPLRCELMKVSGHLELVTGDHDNALDALGEAAQSCRAACRRDLLIEVIALLALLASRMGNAHTAQRYLRELERMENDMQEELR